MYTHNIPMIVRTDARGRLTVLKRFLEQIGAFSGSRVRVDGTKNYLLIYTTILSPQYFPCTYKVGRKGNIRLSPTVLAKHGINNKLVHLELDTMRKRLILRETPQCT